MGYILGIESTAHTFGVAVLDWDGRILANVSDTYTTDEGGMIPLEVRKHHAEVGDELYERALKEANVAEGDLGAVAFSNAPGLAPCLIEGMGFAKGVAKRLGVPLVPVNHCVAHLEIGESCGARDPVMLYASGANTQVIAYAEGKYRVFGETLDLGVGNFIDTVGRAMKLGFPAGAKIEKLALEYLKKNEPRDCAGLRGIGNVVLVHGANIKDRENVRKYGLAPQNERGWFSWIKSELEKRGADVDNPLMPENWDPDYDKWREEFEKLDVGEDSVLVGYSLGTTFLVRWLGDSKRKVGKLILVAPAKVPHGEKYVEEFYDFEIDRKIRDRVGEIVIVKSDDDHDYILESSKIYEEGLGGRVLELKGKGHFTETSMGTEEFPELLGEILGSGEKLTTDDTDLHRLPELIDLPYSIKGMDAPSARSQVAGRRSQELPELLELPYAIKGMDVSFSGMQTKIRNLISKNVDKGAIAYSMQEVVFAMLVEAAERALAHTGKKELLLGGGVGCNARLQEMCRKMCEERGAKFFCPDKSLLVDNAAMIGYLGLKMVKASQAAGGRLEVGGEDIDIAPRERTDDVEVFWR